MKATLLEEAEAVQLLAISKVRSYNRGERFVVAGEIPRQMGFVVKGLFRYVYLDRDGNEFTKNFLPEGSFLASYSAMAQQQSSWFSIESLEDSEILRFDYAAWKRLSSESLNWEKFLRKTIEKAFFIKERRERDLLLLDAETRYLEFVREHPSLEKRVKQHMVASYLGIKPESLSRIKKRLP
ncbi:Crp/Fnr family transcriptional regulator [Pedobacter sp. SYSU D00535]|uniref:Crp/Fnr family transcriptional regulator n=1 Tax=Pedobacter sp. SYSU D00535 TaxID=2810308 RepID=UPI001A97C7B3|nr:Crp/Fnr family transcriptional regulator [Pedobacter sp. SYSU D00535]